MTFIGRMAATLLVTVGAWCGVVAHARPVLVGETPSHTRYTVDDSSLRTVALPQGPAIEARLHTETARDVQAHTIKGQVSADAIMQFRCAEREYRQIETTANNKDGSHTVVVPRVADRRFVQPRPGSFEERLVVATCELRR